MILEIIIFYNVIRLTCETSTGCVLGADGLGRGMKGGEGAGSGAGRALREHIRSGACLDSHAQVSIPIKVVLNK